jgi:hypothetical protein
MCVQKKIPPEQTSPHAVVFSDVNFHGSTMDLWEENGKNQKDIYAKSVITFFKNHELHCDPASCSIWNNATDCSNSSCHWDNVANTCSPICRENCDGSGALPGETVVKNCSLCANQADCNARFTSENDMACHWDTDYNFCYTKCSGQNACGYTLQLFANGGCTDQIGSINAYDNNIVRWVDREIKCVRLIKPNYN